MTDTPTESQAATKALGITPGGWIVNGEVHLVGDSGDMGRQDEYCASIYPASSETYRGEIAYLQSACHIKGIGLKECEANGRLIAEAGTVANRTGLTPKELEAERDRLRADIANAVAEAKKYVPDYPWDDTEETASIAVWALGTSLQGTNLANEDVHREYDRLREVNKELVAEYQKLLNRLKEASELCIQGHSQVAEEICHEMARFTSPAIAKAGGAS